MILYFDDEKAHSLSGLGGKGLNLLKLKQSQYPVPNGIILTSSPVGQPEWDELLSWWQEHDNCQLAVRSSAASEDGEEFSFAGQNATFLNVDNATDLRAAIQACFASIHQVQSQAYRSHFDQSSDQEGMNVVVQEMVDPKFAGVYFSVDPRGIDDGDLIEYVAGIGESLVSGQVKPFKIVNGTHQGNPHQFWSDSYTKTVREFGMRVEKEMKFSVDMEWAIDQEGNFHVLQARPITSIANKNEDDKIVAAEMKRIERLCQGNLSAHWDGQTFSEWSGIPSNITYSLYRKAFSKGRAFDQALEKLGYASFGKSKKRPSAPLLNTIFGRIYLNLEQLRPLYFGDIPYDLVARPKPHLKFNWKLINLKSFLKTPFSIWKMIKVGWNLSSARGKWLSQCRQNLAKFKTKMDRPIDPDFFKEWSGEDIHNRFLKECHIYSNHNLLWPFVLVTMTEGTLSSLKAILNNVLGPDKTHETINRWMSIGLDTITFEMNRYYQRAQNEYSKRAFFLTRYGHRGPGELDLKNPRWVEYPEEKLFKDSQVQEMNRPHPKTCSVEEEINSLKTFKKTVILGEWKFLKSMLELREMWKMEMLRPFAHIRFLLMELSKRSGLGQDIVHLTIDEIKEFKLYEKEHLTSSIKNLVAHRKKEREVFQRYSFSPTVSFQEIIDQINGKIPEGRTSLTGESLSPGIIRGEVKIVRDINDVDFNQLTKNHIVVAESTDPGWTPIFARVGGIIVEKGGILSHAAIVAREMKLPALSGINNCTNILSDGSSVVLDANKGRITYE